MWRPASLPFTPSVSTVTVKWKLPVMGRDLLFQLNLLKAGQKAKCVTFTFENRTGLSRLLQQI